MISVPPGLKLLWKFVPHLDPAIRMNAYKVFVILATFVAYMCFHLTRKPISIVKAVLNHNGNCSGVPPIINVTVDDSNKDTWCDWAPFVGTNGGLGYLDSVYLFSYAVCMFGSGYAAERMHLRYFLSLGMALTGFTTFIFGFGYVFNIHSMGYYIFVQLLAGGVQSMGWPSVVTVMGNWYGKSKRGLIFGVWNAHTSIGNILGALISGAFVDTNWGMSFFVPGIICASVGLFIYLFLPATPEDACFESAHSINVNSEDRDIEDDASLATVPGTRTVPAQLTEDEATGNADENTALLSNRPSERKAISIWGALAIPGVVEFSVSLFFAKLVAYTFMFWLPLYIKSSTTFTPQESAQISSMFDVGGIFGGIAAGYISDRSGASATTSVVFLILSIPMLLIYRDFGSASLALNIILQLILGFLVNGPYALITTAVAAELGSHPVVQKSGSNAMATVTAIIDGTGSVGAALGPLFADLLKNVGSNWLGVFLMVMGSNVFAILLLVRVTYNEIKRLRRGKDVAATL